MTKQTAIEFIQKYGEREVRSVAETGNEPERSMALAILRIAGEVV
jgi:hypothetical protein